MTTLYLTRHGETVDNVAQVLQGCTPGRLTEKGEQQAIELGRRLANEGIHFDALVSSDLARAVHTAQLINESLHLPLTLCPLLRERDFGSFTRVKIDYARSHPVPDDAESVEALFNRAHRFIQYIIDHYPDQTVLAVGHGLFDRCIQAALRGVAIGDIPHMANAEVRRLELTPTSQATVNTADEVSAD